MTPPDERAGVPGPSNREAWEPAPVGVGRLILQDLIEVARKGRAVARLSPEVVALMQVAETDAGATDAATAIDASSETPL